MLTDEKPSVSPFTVFQLDPEKKKIQITEIKKGSNRYPIGVKRLFYDK